LNTTQEKINAVANLRATEAEVAQINLAYGQGQSLFTARLYWWAILSAEDRATFMAGGGKETPKEPLVKAKQFYANNSEVPDDIASFNFRRKRQATLPVRPECVNLPTYKNWVQEGKTAPPQDQKQCG
jgi:hypothetical protein